MSDPRRLELRIDRSSPASAEAMELALALLATRTSGGPEYNEELARALAAVAADSTNAEQSTERLAALLDALATAAAFAATYTAAKLGVERDSLVEAIARALTDIHVEA
jgi:hypothetical protein